MKILDILKRGLASSVVMLLTLTLHASDILPATPNYYDSTQWYVQDRNAVADIFYVVSTEIDDYQLPDGHLCHYADTYNDSVRVALIGEMEGVDRLLSGELNYYSPYYRQCSMQTFIADSLVAKRLPLALEDVSKAFKHYLKHMNQGRPFVLAGFSQGAMTVFSCPRIGPASDATDTGVTICYNSVRDPSCVVHLIGDDNVVAINPVNWYTDDTPASLVTLPSPRKQEEQQTDTLTVRLDPVTHLLLVDGFTGTDYVLPLIGKEGNYHSLEIWFYRKQLRENIALRTWVFLYGYINS